MSIPVTGGPGREVWPVGSGPGKSRRTQGSGLCREGGPSISAPPSSHPWLLPGWWNRGRTHVRPRSVIPSSQQPCKVDEDTGRRGHWGSEKLSHLGSHSKEAEELGLGTRCVGFTLVFPPQGHSRRWRERWGGRAGRRGGREAPGASLSATRSLFPPPTARFFQSTPRPVLSFPCGPHTTERARFPLLVIR